jgi:hypothetical protein
VRVEEAGPGTFFDKVDGLDRLDELDVFEVFDDLDKSANLTVLENSRV